MTTEECATILDRLDRNHGQVRALARSFATVRKAAHRSCEQSSAVLTRLDQLETRIEQLALDVQGLKQQYES